MRRLLGVVVVWLCVGGTYANADLEFQLDSSQSNVVVTFLANAPTGSDTQVDTSALTGTMNVTFGSLSDPFGTAQVTAFDSLLSDGLGFNFNFPFIGAISVTAAPNVVDVALISFGSAGNVNGGAFDQLGNSLRNSGTFVVNGGGFNNSPISFDTSNAQNFIGYQVSRVGDIMSVAGTFDFNWDFEEGVFTGNVRWQGSFVAFAAVPEPTSGLLVGSVCLMAGCLRRRRR